VNPTSAAVLTTMVLPALIEASPSALVLIGSGASRQVFANNAAYVASKHGLADLAGATFLDVRDRGGEGEPRIAWARSSWRGAALAGGHGSSRGVARS
jgi:hypothetical protein